MKKIGEKLMKKSVKKVRNEKRELCLYLELVASVSNSRIKN